ncbi:MAG: type II secretion system F family protein [Candidatus Woesearchaeota archaeon]
MSLAKIIALRMSDLKTRLAIAGLHKRPAEFIDEALKQSMMVAGLMTVLAIFLIMQAGESLFAIIPVFCIFFCIIFFLKIKNLDALKMKREKEIDRDVLFAGRFLLVKLNSGKPLINALVDASESYGVAGKYFKEIVDDINLGTPIEQALEKASRITPSKRFQKILFQINNALKIGVDVSVPLESTLDAIAHEQLIEIQRYGKKLNSMTMFYMLIAIVAPSLGITLFSVIGSIVSLRIDLTIFMVILFFLILIQLAFIGAFKSIRPNLNI